MYKLKVRNEVEPDDIDIYVDSGIEHDVEGYINVRALREQLKDKPFNKVILYVNSKGGDLFEGFAIYNYLNELKAEGHEIEAIISGICASSACVAVMAADKITMYKNSYMMIHESCGVFDGLDMTNENLKQMSELLSKMNVEIMKIYVQRTGLAELTVSELMRRESWLSAETCEALGFCDEVIEAAPVKLETETRIENRIRDTENLRVDNVYKRPDNTQEAINNMAKIINAKRGYVR